MRYEGRKDGHYPDMKTFKQYNEKAQEIRDYDLLNADSYNDAYEILNQMRRDNPNTIEFLGGGQFSIVFGGQGKLVVKLTDSGTDGTFWYLNEAKKRWTSNPHYPRVSAIKTFRVGYGYIAIMEHLNFSIPAIKTAFDVNHHDEIFHITMDYLDGGSSGLYNKLIEKWPKIKQVYDLINDLSEVYESEIDIFYANVAARKNTPVIVDPLGASLSQYN